jgi:hypothetical protein
MKKILFTLFAMLALASQANAMSYEQARREALFLTDKMAYELNLSDAQYEAAYEINLDYLMGVTGRSDVFGTYWERRNADLNFVLYSWQWSLFCAATYFYRPLYWDGGFWHFGVYARYPHRDYYYFGRPHFYASYRGGHCWRLHSGRSYYERHHAHYRPHTHRDHHIGMRDGWNRGDYKSRGNGNSSTRITGRSGDSRGNGGFTLGNARQRSHDQERGSNRSSSRSMSIGSSTHSIDQRVIPRSTSSYSVPRPAGNSYGVTRSAGSGANSYGMHRSAGSGVPSRSMSVGSSSRSMGSSSSFSMSHGAASARDANLGGGRSGGRR